MTSDPLLPLSFVDSPLFGASFVDARVRDVFNFRSYVQRCVETEVALARAEARLGIIPEVAAAGIAAAAETYPFDLDRLRRETEIVGYPILPLVEQLADAAGEAGRYLHWGATTQDIMDTATVLQVRAAIEVIETRLAETVEALRRLAALHRDTPMAGRTHLQHALPITFGYKAAVWLSALQRHRERIEQMKPRLLMIGFPARPEPLPHLATRACRFRRSLRANSVSLCRRSPGIPAATASPKRSNSSA
ncbi:hypothetical protein MES4922_300037 [Mesorhizobium ventifaucium]|uniref:Fumarate lyase N-terminal domain-containing protein n=1 Tax=Mesorhizobium ventifaucium TaxID=666020 RepID=A0ABN8JXK2_9HYPH|nr:hypothetical protein MES4922_300037 [Mesorhizobium ventifaucium]